MTVLLKIQEFFAAFDTLFQLIFYNPERRALPFVSVYNL